MQRNIIRIDEELCNGCEQCVTSCAEGAIAMVDGKARVVSEVYCDGLGACLADCPEGAITIEKREAEAYDELQVIEHLAAQGPRLVKEHLEHLAEHGQTEDVRIAIEYLRGNGLEVPPVQVKLVSAPTHAHAHAGGCPGSAQRDLKPKQGIAMGAGMGAGMGASTAPIAGVARLPQLGNWPIQLHLLSPDAPSFQGRDVLLAADCVPFALPGFHEDYLSGKALAIACPKLDQNQDIYLEKLKAFIDRSQIRSLTVMIMEVPCCMGLTRLAQQAVSEAAREVELKTVVVGVQGNVLHTTGL